MKNSLTLLNYETNDYKILQLVLVSQMELLPRISRISNFWDRIALKYVLNPLGQDEVKQMINFRLKEAGYSAGTPLFTDEAIRIIWEWTQGYPRKLTLFCHNSLENLVMYDKKIVDSEIVRSVIDAEVRATEVVVGSEDAVPVGAGTGVALSAERRRRRSGVRFRAPGMRRAR